MMAKPFSRFRTSEKSSYYVWFLGARESRGLRGLEFVTPVVTDLLQQEQHIEPAKVTLQVSDKGLKIVQHVPKKTDRARHEAVKHFIPDHAISFACQQEDVVSCILLIFNPVTRCPVHVHTYRCDATSTAEALARRLTELASRPENSHRVEQMESRLISRGLLALHLPEVDQEPSEEPAAISGASPAVNGKTRLQDSLVEELRDKIGGRDAPLLLPPRDYDEQGGQEPAAGAGGSSGSSGHRPDGSPRRQTAAHRSSRSPCQEDSSGIGSDELPNHQSPFHQLCNFFEPPVDNEEPWTARRRRPRSLEVADRIRLDEQRAQPLSIQPAPAKREAGQESRYGYVRNGKHNQPTPSKDMEPRRDRHRSTEPVSLPQQDNKRAAEETKLRPRAYPANEEAEGKPRRSGDRQQVPSPARAGDRRGGGRPHVADLFYLSPTTDKSRVAEPRSRVDLKLEEVPATRSPVQRPVERRSSDPNRNETPLNKTPNKSRWRSSYVEPSSYDVRPPNASQDPDPLEVLNRVNQWVRTASAGSDPFNDGRSSGRPHERRARPQSSEDAVFGDATARRRPHSQDPAHRQQLQQLQRPLVQRRQSVTALHRDSRAGYMEVQGPQRVPGLDRQSSRPLDPSDFNPHHQRQRRSDAKHGGSGQPQPRASNHRSTSRDYENRSDCSAGERRDRRQAVVDYVPKQTIPSFQPRPLRRRESFDCRLTPVSGESASSYDYRRLQNAAQHHRPRRREESPPDLQRHRLTSPSGGRQPRRQPLPQHQRVASRNQDQWPPRHRMSLPSQMH